MLKINNLQKKIIKISTVISLVMIFSFFLINKVSAATSDVYDMSSWIDISEFTLPSGITTETHNIIIYYKDSSTGYRLLAWKKGEDIYPKIFRDSDIFPTTLSLIFNNWSNSSSKNVNYYNAINSTSKTFNTITGNSTNFSNTKIIYSNVNIYATKNDRTDLWFDLDLVNFEPTSYEFNEDIDVTDISKIKINFELPEDTSNLGLELDFSIKGLTENAGTIGAPYVSLTSKDENNYDQVDIIDFDYGVSERANLISNMCDIVDCWDTFDSTKYSATFETCIDNLEKIDSVDINKPRLIKEELSNWYTDEYVDKLYDSALILVNKTYILNTSYSNKLYMSLLPDSTTYKYSLEIDTINYQGTLNLNFTSNLNYSIEYEYVVDNVDYYVTIDMSKYSALVLIPKVYYGDTNTSASFLSDMYLNGTYDIELWEDLESKNVLERYNNYNNSVFSHYFDYHYKSSILYFINKNIGVDGSYIKFDSRYYNYALKNNLTEEVIITNPNTGEDMTIPDISDLYDYGSSKDGRFTFNSFLKPIKFVFESITDFYNNYCPEIVQYFFYIIFTFFVLLVLIKIFL